MTRNRIAFLALVASLSGCTAIVDGRQPDPECLEDADCPLLDICEGPRECDTMTHLCVSAGQPLDCDEFVCGDSDDARAETAKIVQLVPGVRPIDVGPLTRARSIEHLTALAIAINRRHKIHDARFRVVGLP